MSKQYNKAEKRKRRNAYLKRKKAGAKATVGNPRGRWKFFGVDDKNHVIKELVNKAVEGLDTSHLHGLIMSSRTWWLGL